MFSQAYALIAIASLAYASYTDLKERIVSNRLTFAMLAAGVGLHAYESIATGSSGPIIFSISAGALMFVFSYILWRIGAWAGGDVKLFTALATLLPLPFMGTFSQIYGIYPIFPFMILVNSILLSFPFIMLYVVWKTIKNRELHKHFSKMVEESMIKTIIYGLALVGFPFVIDFLGLPGYSLIILLIALTLVPGIPRLIIPLVLFSMAIIVEMRVYEALTIFVNTFLFMMLFYSITYGRKHALRERIATSKLKEGMIPAETLYKKGKKILKYSPTWKDLASRPFHEPESTIISATKAAGLEESEIRELRKLGIKSIMVKESVPMIPIVLLGTIASLWVGDIIWIIMQAI